MSKYWLPCACGRSNAVSVTQSGATITCNCGTQLVVPSLRALRDLPQADQSDTAAPRPEWSMRHAIRVMAGLALVLALAGWGLQWLLMPRDPDPPIEVEPLTAYQSMQLWLNLAAGIDDSYKHTVQQFIANRAERRFWSNVSLTAAALSLAVFAGTFVWPAPHAPRAPRAPRGRAR